MNKYESAGYVRISKAAARNRHISGLACYIIPVNIRPDNMYMPAVGVPVYDPKWATFDEFVDRYTIYNCTGSETGRYPAFYVRIDAQGNVYE